MRKRLVLLGIMCALISCKSAPPQIAPEPAPPLQPGNPSASLEFDRLEGVNAQQVTVHYRLVINNPRSQALEISIKNWEGSLNGTPFDAAAVLKLDGAAPETALRVEPQSRIEKPITLNLGLSLNDGYECLAELAIGLDYRYADDAVHDEVSAQVTFPRVMEPSFAITSITILQADLINTRLKLGMKIDNPNIFPITLSSFRYELYGDGNFWADGTEKNLSVIPAQSSVQTGITINMNFIGMRRRILDDIIAMREVRYRIAGRAEVGTDVPWLPVFRKNFDLSGLSPVIK